MYGAPLQRRGTTSSPRALKQPRITREAIAHHSEGKPIARGWCVVAERVLAAPSPLPPHREFGGTTTQQQAGQPSAGGAHHT
ncbi:MAG: hypothetical protein ACOYBJ_01725 [Patescibacteria group bacterium]